MRGVLWRFSDETGVKFSNYFVNLRVFSDGRHEGYDSYTFRQRREFDCDGNRISSSESLVRESERIHDLSGPGVF